MTIDGEFQKLIPPLTDDEYRQLEENCIKEGIREAILVWDRGDDLVIVDGHNRYQIARKNGLKWNHKVMNFESREAVKEWIIKNQFGRRNLSAYDRSILALKLKPLIAEKAKEKEHERKTTCQKSDKSYDTKKELAKVAGVSHDTIHKVEKIEAEATPQVKQAVRDGKLSINQAYNSTFPKVLNPTREARKEHEEFREKAKEGMVDFTEAKKDKLNQEILYHSFVQDIYKATGAVSRFGLLYQTKDIEAFAEKIPQDLKAKIILNIGISINTLNSLKKILERRKQ